MFSEGDPHGQIAVVPIVSVSVLVAVKAHFVEGTLYCVLHLMALALK